MGLMPARHHGQPPSYIMIYENGQQSKKPNPEYYRFYSEKNKRRISEYKKKHFSEHPECLLAMRTHSKNFERTCRLKLFSILGNKCSNPECLVPGGCTDIRCLQMHHVNGGGNKERKGFKNIRAYYTYYLEHQDEAKERLQTLCANCNWIEKFEGR